ncbi:MAG: 2-aminoadipate transaminase [Solirubrobacteraceae bacterium]|jgi:DNA-binding transcriptional MocR family regulator|nr:2-aminoadipate transaminase [Solirubrobacteraceae bacterium]
MPTPPISFARGAPSLDIIDVDGLAAAATRAFAEDPAGATAYGTSVGYVPLRRWIADRHGVDEAQVLVTNGSMQADAFFFDELAGPGDEVIVERPTYDRTLLALGQRGAKVHAVSLESDGIDTAAVEDLLKGGARPTFAHIIPTFQNPAGCTISLAKRQKLLELAGEYDFTIFEDDPYVSLRFTGDSIPSMQSLDHDGHVVYACSFTKTVCPGVRVGYLIGSPPIIAKIAKRATSTYISPNMVSQALVHQFCLAGALERSIETVKAALHQRADVLCDALERELPGSTFVRPTGGYFLWVTLPDGIDAASLVAAAAERKVIVLPGTDFMLDGGNDALRLAYSGVSPAEIEDGVARIGEAARAVTGAAA